MKAIQKLILSNNIEYAYAIAKCFYPRALDQVLYLLHLKCMESEALKLCKVTMESISNPKFKKLVQTSFSMNHEEDENKDNQSSGASSIFDLLSNCQINVACIKAVNSFKGKQYLKSHNLNIESESSGVIRFDTLENFFFLGLFDLESISDE